MSLSESASPISISVPPVIQPMLHIYLTLCLMPYTHGRGGFSIYPHLYDYRQPSLCLWLLDV